MKGKSGARGPARPVRCIGHGTRSPAHPALLRRADRRPFWHAEAAAATLMSTADNLAEIIPGAQRSLAAVREHGTAELAFGVLRIFLRRVGAPGNSFVIAAFM